MSYNQKLSIRLIFKKEWVFGETWHPKQRLIFLLRGKYCNNKKNNNPKSAVNKGFWHETYRNKDTEGKRWRSNTGQHCSCKMGHLAVRGTSRVPSPSPGSLDCHPVSQLAPTVHSQPIKWPNNTAWLCWTHFPDSTTPLCRHHSLERLTSSCAHSKLVQNPTCTLNGCLYQSNTENEPEGKCWDRTCSAVTQLPQQRLVV